MKRILRQLLALAQQPSQKKRRAFLRVEALEDRLAPAFDLAIHIGMSQEIEMTAVGNTSTFQPVSSGATLSLEDIYAELRQGRDVLISTGVHGGGADEEAGSILWSLPSTDILSLVGSQWRTFTWDGVGEETTINLNTIAGHRSLTFHAAGDIILNLPIADPSDVEQANSLSLSLVAGGDVRLGSGMTNLTDIAIQASGDVTLPALSGVKGNLNVRAGGETGITLTGSLSFADGSVVLAGNVVLAPDAGLIVIETNTDMDAQVGDVSIIGSLNAAPAATQGEGEMPPPVTQSLTICAVGGDVLFGGAIGNYLPLGDLRVTAGDIQVMNDIALHKASGDVNLLLRGATTFGASMDVLSLRADDGYSGVTLGGEIAQLSGDLKIELGDEDDVISVASGMLDLAGYKLTTNGHLHIGGDFFADASLSGTGTVQAKGVVVQSRGQVYPGGEETIGTLTVQGALTFEAGSTLHADFLGSAADRVVVTGAATVEAGAAVKMIGSGSGPYTLLTARSRTGTFTGAEADRVVVLGHEAFTSTYDATSMRLRQSDAGPNTIVGATHDGSVYTIRLLGLGASMVVADHQDGSPLDIVLRNATTANSLVISVVANGGSGQVAVDALRVNGALGSVQAPTTNLVGEASVTSLLGSLTVANLYGSLRAGGLASQATTLLQAGYIGDVALGSRLTTLRAHTIGNSAGTTTIQTPALGTVTVSANAAVGASGDWNANLLLDAGSPAALALGSMAVAGSVQGGVWDIRGKIGSVTIGRNLADAQIGTSDVAARYANQMGDITSLVVRGNVADSVIHSVGRLATVGAGSWTSSSLAGASLGKLTVGTATLPGRFEAGTVTLTSSFGTARNAIDSVLITGAVVDSVFRVYAGNVASFTVARFENSKLHIGYLPGANFATRGTFLGNYALVNFRTTQVFTAGLVDTLAFTAGSEIVAARFGTIRLSGVRTDNASEAFGLRCNGVANRGSVRVTVARPTAVQITDLVPSFRSGDFAFLA